MFIFFNNQVQKLPSINQELALKLRNNENDKNLKKRQAASSLLKDERFKALFSNPDFQVDKDSVEYTLLNPVISQLGKTKARKLKQSSQEEVQDRSDQDEKGNNEYLK